MKSNKPHARLNLNASGSKEQKVGLISCIESLTSEKELIAAAFAGDNVIEEEFIKEKQALVEQETPKDKDVTLPGWGAWGGGGISDPFPKRCGPHHCPASK